MNSGDQDAKPSVFTDAEVAYLHGERRLGRIASVGSVGSDGTPHVVPVGWIADCRPLRRVTPEELVPAVTIRR